MKRKVKKLLGIALALVMVFGSLSWLRLTALAEGEEPYETINLSGTQSEGDEPASKPVTVSGLNAEAVGYPWNDNLGWPVGNYGGEGAHKNYDLTIKTKNGKATIVKVVLEIGHLCDSPEEINADPSGSITIEGQSALTYENSAGAASVRFSYTPKIYNKEDYDDSVYIKSATIYYGAADTYTVTVTPGQNMTKTEDSGAQSQADLSGAMTDVVYTANNGYKFPTSSEYYRTTFGITVTRTSDTVVTVSGTPTADADIIVPNAVPEADVVMGVSLNLSSAALIERGKQALTATIDPSCT